jgi:ribosome biogenesis GTPase A
MHKGQKSSAKLLRKTVKGHMQTITHTQHNLKDTVIIIVIVILVLIFKTKQNVTFERVNELST